MTDVKPQPALFPPPPPPAAAIATPADRAELLVQLRARRQELVDAYAVGLALGEPLAPSAVQPLATVQGAIMAIEAELATEQWDANPDSFNTEATPPGHDGDIGRDQ